MAGDGDGDDGGGDVDGDGGGDGDVDGDVDGEDNILVDYEVCVLVMRRKRCERCTV